MEVKVGSQRTAVVELGKKEKKTSLWKNRLAQKQTRIIYWKFPHVNRLITGNK